MGTVPIPLRRILNRKITHDHWAMVQYRPAGLKREVGSFLRRQRYSARSILSAVGFIDKTTSNSAPFLLSDDAVNLPPERFIFLLAARKSNKLAIGREKRKTLRPDTRCRRAERCPLSSPSQTGRLATPPGNNMKATREPMGEATEVAWRYAANAVTSCGVSSRLIP